MKTFVIALLGALLSWGDSLAQPAALAPARRDTVSSAGQLYTLRQSRFTGTGAIEYFPRPKHTCQVGGGRLVQSGWLAFRGSWWVVVDTVASCGAMNSIGLDTRVDSGIVGGTADGRGYVLMRALSSPLPGPAAVARSSSSYGDVHRFADTLTMIGADSSHVFVYVLARAR